MHFGAEGDRTPGLDIANVALSQLSYSPVPKIYIYTFNRTSLTFTTSSGYLTSIQS